MTSTYERSFDRINSLKKWVCRVPPLSIHRHRVSRLNSGQVLLGMDQNYFPYQTAFRSWADQDMSGQLFMGRHWGVLSRFGERW
jgi:hypothetical protein